MTKKALREKNIKKGKGRKITKVKRRKMEEETNYLLSFYLCRGHQGSTR
jgi:hypothetical protein